MNNTFSVILDYKGGTRTDSLYEDLTGFNEKMDLSVLDNASPQGVSKYANVFNAQNSYIGGGIRDCIKLARSANKQFLLFITNDIKIKRHFHLPELEKILLQDDDVVQVSASLSNTSDKSYYPWMYSSGRTGIRRVHHADFLFTFIRISFVEFFGGFPNSKSGWGYDWEFSYQAARHKRKILICDDLEIEHHARHEVKNYWKSQELKQVYNRRYGDYKTISPYNIYISKDSKTIIKNLCKSSKPIIIIGMHRSGTSFLSRVVEQSGVFMGKAKDPNNESFAFLNSNKDCLKKSNFSWYKPGVPQQWITDERLSQVVLGHFGLYFFDQENINEVLQAPWGWKDPRTTLTLEMWLSFFPNAKVIHIHRNPYRVADSLRSRNSQLPRESPYFVPELDKLNGGLNLWVEYAKIALEHEKKFKQNFIRVSYEKLTEMDQKHITALESFLKLDLNQSLKKSLELDPDRGALHLNLNMLMKDLGYTE